MSEGTYLWTEALTRAIRWNRRDAHDRYLQLATVRPDGTPAVRSLVFREFDEDAPQLRMVTDRRSGKVSEIAMNPAGEICWYFSHSREQFRLRGTLTLTGAEADDQRHRRSCWESLSQKGREQFYWPPPGAGAVEGTPAPSALVEEGPPEDFLLLALTVNAVDHLTLRGDPQQRVLSEVDPRGVWVSRPVNP